MTRPRKRRFGFVFLLLLVAAVAAAFVLWQRYAGFADAPISGFEDGASVVVQSGDSLPVVVRKLREAGVPNTAVLWEGIQGWVSLGYPVVQGRAAKPEAP